MQPQAAPALAFVICILPCLAVAQTPPANADKDVTLPEVKVTPSADASAQGLSPAYPGGQVARGGRAGILGTRDSMDTPFSITSYTNELIQDRQARSVGEVLQNDPSVRVARGFGNFQESYFIRGFVLGSDNVAFNGLYSLMPRQYIATELFERVEVLRGASAFLTGATPGGDGIGGAINLLPKRAPNEPLTRLTLGGSTGPNGNLSADIARRFGPDQSFGIRLNAAVRDGDTAVDHEKASLGVGALGLDWRSASVRLSADIGWQDNRLDRTRTNVMLDAGVASVPRAPDSRRNFAQPWSYSNERDFFGTLRGEVDLGKNATAWAAYGLRRSDEGNSLANVTVTAGTSGAGNTSRFDNEREDKVDTGEVGLRGKIRTGPVGHEWVVSAAFFEDERKNAFAFDFANLLATNLYRPSYYAKPAFSPFTFFGNDLDSPALTDRLKLTSIAVGDTLSFVDDTVLLTLGVRDQKLKLESFAYGTGARTVYDKSHVSPAAGLVVKLDKRLSLYGNYIEGLTPGDTAPALTVNVGQRLAPYVSKQKELGAKIDSGRFGAGIALFSTTKPRGIVNEANVFAADGEDRHRGVEVTVYGEATRGLRVLGGATWLDAEQQQTGSAATDGKRVIGVPRFQANLGAEWDVPGVQGLAVDGRIVHTGATYADAANALRVPSWTRFDVGLRYLVPIQDRLLTLRARIDNVTDRDYWASSGGYPGLGYLVLGAPRTFTLSASIDF